MTLEQKRMVVPFSIQFKQEDEDSEFFEFSGYASTFGNIDRGDDVVERGAFRDSVMEIMKSGSKGRLPVLWHHDYDNPVGIFTEIMEDDKGLFVRGRMPKSDTFVSGRVMPQLGVGSVKSMSIGYRTIVSEYDSENDVRILKELKLYEISLVTVPMNTEATIDNFKSAPPLNGLSDKTPRELEALLKSGVKMSGKEAKTVVSRLSGDLRRDDEDEAARDVKSEDYNAPFKAIIELSKR